MSRNGNITSFFKPAPKSSQSPRPRRATPAASPTPPPLSLPPLPPLPSQPSQPSPSPPPPLFSSSPPVPTSAVRDRNTVIRGSDDEDDDDDDLSSDDEFPDLFSKPSGSTAPGLPARTEASLYATPKAKRRALEFHSSPLTINARHKFDLRTLLKHAEADQAIKESEAALLAQGSHAARASGTADRAHASLHDTMLSVLSDPEDSQDEVRHDRLLRAVKRTEAAQARKEWYFFDRLSQPPSPPKATRPTFPTSEATGVWAFLAPKTHRSEIFEDGLPHTVQSRTQDLPDGIFQWVLSEVRHEQSRKLREEYIRLLGLCSPQIGRLLDEQVVDGLFRDLGATDRALAGSSQPSGSSTTGAPCPEHDRPRLQTVLRILAGTAHALKLQALTRTLGILLRLGVDNIMREDQAVATDYQDALLEVVRAVPPRFWDNFCGDVVDSLYHHTQDATLRWNAVSSIPLLHPRLAELRRRLALVFVFDDPRRAFSPPDATFSVRSVIDRLDQADEFIIDRTNTDYFELLALSEMLSVAVGDASPPAEDASPEAVKQFNAEVDELSQKIKVMWSNIHEQGAAYMSRLEVRVQLRDFERKLQHVVRTRRPPKEDIFGLRATSEDEIERPRQQEFMKRYFKNDPPPQTAQKGGGQER